MFSYGCVLSLLSSLYQGKEYKIYNKQNFDYVLISLLKHRSHTHTLKVLLYMVFMKPCVSGQNFDHSFSVETLFLYKRAFIK